jgi:hypothetical protein
MTSTRSERREAPRFDTTIPVEIANDRKRRIGIGRNASARGLLVASQGKFEVGEKVTLRFKVTPQDAETVVRGSVVRHDVDDEAYLWPHLIAVRLHESLEPLLGDLRALG